MSKNHYFLSLLTIVIICLQACGGSGKPDPSTPDGSILTNINAIKANDLSAYMDNVLTAEQKTKLTEQWNKKRSSTPPSDMEKQQFEAQMKSMTSGEMITQMMPMVEQKLAEINNEQISGYISMFGGMLLNSPDLDAKQKEQLSTLISSLTEWVKTADVTNPEKVRSFMKSVQATAQKLNLKTLDEVQAMTFDQLIDKGDIVFAGLKDALNVYNISIDDVLNSVKVDKVELNGEFANITVSFEVFGSKQTATTTLKKVGNMWIEAKMSEKLNETLSNL